ncbi:MAG: dihydrodipicolinate synthase family protein [Actinobacteria bacterium]|nr:dihydrodipicolinate synthase family protein [Actinomycetota bacterium]
MDRNDVEWKGYMPAITTPYRADGPVDFEGWQTLVEWMVAEGMHGIVVAGSSGEWFSMEPEERVALFELAHETVAGRVPVLGCANAIRVTESLRYLREAERIGLDGVVLAVPPYAVPNEAETVAFYEKAAAETSLPLCLYNWPRGTGVDLSVAMIERLAEIETVVAIKNSTRSFESFVAAFEATGGELRHFGFGTDELSMKLITEQGGDGTIGGGAVLGNDHPAYYEALWAGDLEEARRRGGRDKAFFEFSMMPNFDPTFASAQAIMKAALNLRGLPGGCPRPPYLPLTDEEIARTREFLAGIEVPIENPTGDPELTLGGRVS